MHLGVEVTELSTNKQHHLSHKSSGRAAVSTNVCSRPTDGGATRSFSPVHQFQISFLQSVCAPCYIYYCHMKHRIWLCTDRDSCVYSDRT